MPMYDYKGINRQGRGVNGILAADSPKSLRTQLRKDGVTVVSYGESKGGKKQSDGKGLGKEVHFGNVLGGANKKDVTAFTRQLATLIKAGIPLSESLTAMYEQQEKVQFKSIVGEIRTAVNEGSSLAAALQTHSKVYDQLYVSMVRSGELAGNLDEVLTRLADFLESSQKLKSKVQGAMMYPMMMAVIGSLIMGVLMVKVVPQITQTFAQGGKTLPWYTQTLVGVSGFLGAHWWKVLLAVAASIYGFVRWKSSEAGKRKWHRFVLKSPLIGPLARRVGVTRFARTLGTLLKAGVPMLSSLDTARDTMGNVILQDAVTDVREAVQEGASLAGTIKKTGQFPGTVSHMVAVGERAGQLEDMLMRVADAYDIEVEQKLDRATAFLEPMMLVAMGGAVAFIVFSILGPMMDMSQFAR